MRKKREQLTKSLREQRRRFDIRLSLYLSVSFIEIIYFININSYGNTVSSFRSLFPWVFFKISNIGWLIKSEMKWNERKVEIEVEIQIQIQASTFPLVSHQGICCMYFRIVATRSVIKDWSSGWKLLGGWQGTNELSGTWRLELNTKMYKVVQREGIKSVVVEKEQNYLRVTWWRKDYLGM